MNTWIPINVRPAPKGKDILICYEDDYYGNKKIVIARYVVKFTEECYEDHSEYSEEHDNYFVPEGWYEQIENSIDDYSSILIEGEVTHWMKLPEPPNKEFENLED